MFGRKRRELLANGKLAPAVIVSVEDRWTGSQTTHPFLVTLRVKPEDEPEFDVTKKLRFARLSPPRPGSLLWVRYDPDDHDEFAVDQDKTDEVAAQGFGALGLGLGQPIGVVGAPAAGAPAMAPDPLDRLGKLAELRDSGVLSQAEFEEQKRKILAEA